MFRRALVGAGCVFTFISIATWSCVAASQEYPSRPLRIIVGFAASGGADVAARLVAHRLTEALGQNVIVENRPGAGGSIAAQQVANATPDGHTLLMIAAGSATILPATRSLPYNIQRNFAPISLVAIGAYVLATHPASNLKSVSELIAAAKGQPGKITYGTSGAAGTGHICGLLFEQLAGVRMLHVPYKGGSGAVVGAAGREVDLSITAITSAQPLIESGTLRPLAVTTLKRSALLPAVPTLDESGLRGFDRATWWGLLGPARMPTQIVSRLNDALVAAFNRPDMKNAMQKLGAESRTSSPKEFAELIRRDLVDNSKLVQAAGLAAPASK
jgi:tripartite-type tricarboxylate transporter receptor subunit TctC